MSKVEELESILPQLPEEAVEELLLIAQRWQQFCVESPKITPVKLGGLWKGVEITDEDIREMRREAWAGFGEGRDLE